MLDRLLLLWMTFFGVLLHPSNAITKSFVNSSMPDMRPTFVVNFDTGTVICQHSPHPDDLHLHQISIICDGKPDCYSNPAMHDESFPYCGSRCNSTCNQRGACLFDGTQGQCYCNAGYHGPHCELNDNNECKDKPCHWLAHCRNTYGSYSCTCFPGFQGDGHECSDINECETGIARCPEYSTCVNLPGTYFCNCTKGFQPLGIPLERCADIDECVQEMHNCPENFKCQNEIGKFKCVEECDDGYRLKNGTCVDIDECAEKTSKCNKRASCVNTIGSHQCICEDGFTGDGENCTPLNDCSQQEGICDRHAFCIGTLRMCICQSGYIGDGLNCYDVNECEAKHNPCEGQIGELRCVNIDGGYICCEQDLDDKRCIREKGAFCSGGCGLHAVCYNETCQCMEGFSGDPRVKCSDINECEDDKQCPGAGEWCVNLFGGFVCCSADSKNPECLGSNSKLDGIRRTFSTGSIHQKTTGGFVIIDRQVISAEQFGLACYFGCPPDSHCVNGTCRCNDGFIGNTFEGCADVNECKLGLCNHSDSWCVNLRGSFLCCTANSTLSDCTGLEITDVHRNSFENKGEHLVLPSAIGKITGGMRSNFTESDGTASASSAGSANDSWSGSFSKGELSGSGRRNSWTIETVGEWKNFTGHAIIIGRGRIESKKWNVTRDKNGALVGIEVRGNQTKIGKYFESSSKEGRAEGSEKGEETEGSGEGIETNNILGVDGTTHDGTPKATILPITKTSSPQVVGNSGEVYKIREEVTGKPEIIIFQSSKATINQTPIESRISLGRSSESPAISTLKSSKAAGIISSGINTSQDSSGKFTISKIPETATYSTDTKSISEARLMKSVKLETTTSPKIDKTESTITITGSDLIKSKESISTTANTDKETVMITPSTVEEQLRTTTYITSKDLKMQMGMTDIDSLTSPNQAIITEAVTSPSIPESKLQWKKEGDEKLQQGNTVARISGADVAISVKEETVTPVVIEVTRKGAIIVIPESDLPNSISKFEKPAKLHGTSSPLGGRSHEATLKVGLEIAKASLTTDRQIGIEIVEASGEHVSENSGTVEVDATFYPYSKSTKPVQLIESTMKFESDLTSVSQKTESDKSEFTQKSVSVETTQAKAKTVTLEQSTEVVGSTEVPSTFEKTSKKSEIDDTVSRNIVIPVDSTNSLLSFNQFSMTTPNAVSVSFSKPISHVESQGTIATKYSFTTINETPTETGTDTSKESSTSGTLRLSTSSVSQAATANLSVKLTSGDAAEKVTVVGDEKTEPVSGHSKSAATEVEKSESTSAKSIEVEGSGEEVTEFQTVSSTKGFVSNTVIETNDLLRTVATDDITQEVGLEIVLMKGYPKTTESVIGKTSAPIQRNWTNIYTSPDVILNASLSFVPTEKEDMKSISDSAKGKLTTGGSSILDSHNIEETTASGAIKSGDFEKTGGIIDVNTNQNTEATHETTDGKKRDSFEEGKVIISKEIGPTTSIYRSEIVSTSTTEIAVISKPSTSESTEMFRTTSETFLPSDMEARLRNTLKPAGDDETTLLQEKDEKLGSVTTPQSKESLKTFSSSSAKEIRSKVSEISEEPRSLTVENKVRVETTTEGVGKEVMMTDETIKYSSYSTTENLSSGSVTMTETASLKPSISSITEKNVFVKEELVTSNGSEVVSGGKRLDVTTSGSPDFGTAEVSGAASVTKASDESKKWAASSAAKFTTTVSELATTSAANKTEIEEQIGDISKSVSGTNGLTSSVTEMGGTRSSEIPDTIKLETSLISESISTKGGEHGISRTIDTTRETSSSDIFSQSRNTETSTISMPSSDSVTVAEQKTSGIKLDETTTVSKSERTTKSVASETGATKHIAKNMTLESIKDENFSKFVTRAMSTKSELESTTNRANILETAPVGATERESVSVQEAASSIFKTDMQATASLTSRTSKSPSFPSTEIVTNYGSTITVTSPKSFSSSLAVSGTKEAISEPKQFLTSIPQVTPSITTSTSQVFETSLDDSATRTTLAEKTIVLQHYESSKADVPPTPTLSKIEIVSTIGSTESKTARWTIKPEQAGKSEIVPEMKTTIRGLISEMETTESVINPLETTTEIKHTSSKSSVSDEGLLRITQQETVSPLYANILKSGENVTTTKETYSLKGITETSITQKDTQIVTLHCRSSDECGVDAYCERRSGVCRCYSGFDGQPPMMPCVDIDECERHLDDCDSTSRCSNKVGGFMCFCETGYRMSKEHICVDIDECQERAGRPCSQHATCINIPGSYRCQCNLGYTGDGYTCIPMEKRHCKEDELTRSNCGRNHLCLVDGKGEIDCDTCKKGFLKEGINCVDINECAQSDVCHENAFCENIMGSYSCHCHLGYKGDGSRCEDIDECENNPCHPQAICYNSPGSFICKCPDEWVGDGKNECINPFDTACLDKVSVCNQTNHTSCLSVNLGTVTMSICECPANYRYNPTKHICEDIDECAENRYSCDPSNSICVNIDGGHICECAPGYEGVGGVCVDVNECERGIAGCNVAAQCENYLGSVGCKCPRGFIGNGIHCIATESLFTKADSGCNDEWKRTCHDVNRTCHIDDEDIPQCGSCIIGYQPLNGRCLPVQEAGNCANPQKNDCDVNAECIDVHPGRHFCTCKVGYIGDGRHCDDIDECSLPGACDPAANCRNTNGSFTCICQFGYIGNGFKCIPKFNKHGGPNCHLNVSMCHKNARCQLDGTCKCSNGYQGDGVDICQLVSEEKQDEKTFGNKTDVSKVTKADTVTEKTKEGSATFTNDSDFASGFGTSFKTISVTEVIQTTNDMKSQQSSTSTARSTSIIKESSGRENITAATTSSARTSSGWISEISHVTISEGSGEGDSISRDWQHSTKPGDRLFTTEALPSEIVSVREKSSEGATSVLGSGTWIHPGSTSSPTGAIISDKTQKLAVQRCSIANQSACHELAHCAEQSGECVCKLGYHGDGYSICIKDTENCTSDPTVCDLRAVCDITTHTCRCIQGYVGDGIICAPDTFDCLLRPNLCSNFAECIGRRCKCNAGYTGDGTECVTVEPLQDCTRCDTKAKCYNETCICDKGYFGNGAICIPDPADCVHYPGLCHSNAICDQEKRRCKCTRGYTGNGMECSRKKDLLCFNDTSICDQNAECLATGICQCKQGFEGNGYYCRAVEVKFGKVVQTTESNVSECKQQCVANEQCYRGECRCAEGYKRGQNGTCMDIDECSMGTHDCHPVALCTNVPGSFTCICPTGYHGNGRKCSQHHRLHNMSVDCELDGMTLVLVNDPDLYDGRIFVRGQTDNPFCSKKLNALLANETEYHLIIHYAHCNVRFEEPNTIAVTVVIQRHPMFITERADAYDVRCTYPVGVRKVVSHVGISEITTTKTIVETGIGPTCSLTVTNEQDQLIDTATVGQPLKLALTVYPNDTYAVLPRNCFAINLETGELYLLTDQGGCAIDTELFPEWTYRKLWLTTARFRTFKWPDSSMIRFQCDCSACIESCPKVNCTKRHESMKQRRFRHIREIPRNSVDEELEKHIVKGTKWMAYSGALYVNEEEELVRAQRDMKRWKYQGLETYEEPVDTLYDSVCIRALWIILSLLPLLLLLVLIGLLSATWRKKSSAKMRWRRAGINDSGSSYLKF